MSKLTISLLISVFLIGGLSVVSQRHAIACDFVDFTSYTEVVPKTFISPAIPLSKHREITSFITAAKQRVNSTFGEMQLSPNVVVTHTENEAAFFGSNPTGKAHLTPLGGCLVLGPKGHNVDVAAHELVHAESFFRVGWINQLLSVPTWFNEGIALIVDHRAPFLVENIKLHPNAVEQVKSKIHGFQFFDGENERQHYIASRLAVNNIKHALLFEKLDEIGKGRAFSEVFGM